MRLTDLFIYKKGEGERVAPWYYGVTYRDWYTQTTVFHPIPINYIIRALHEIKFAWDRFRRKPTRIDIEVEKKLRYINEIQIGRKEGE